MTLPAQRDAREDAYNLSRGLSAVTERLAILQARGEAILAAAETLTADETVDPDDSPAPY